MGLLIVDDSVETCQALKTILEAAGYEDVRLAYTTSDALRVLGLAAGAGPAAPPDAILLDLRIPPIDGVEACRRIKECDEFKDVPIIMMTGWGGAGQLEAAFAAGAFDYLTKPIDPPELLARLRSAIHVKQELGRRKERVDRLTEMNRQVAQELESMRHLACRDELTGAANRRTFNQVVQREWARAARQGEPLALVMADVDCFKSYNDRYGHPNGDRCLRSVAHALRSALRRPGDLLARYGGEEFAVILPNTPPAGAAAVAEEMRRRLAERNLPHAGSPSGRVTVSLGVATRLPDSAASADDLVRAADDALYRAKRDGRDCVRLDDVGSAADPAGGPAGAGEPLVADLTWGSVIARHLREVEEYARRTGQLNPAWEGLMRGLRNATRRIRDRVHSALGKAAETAASSEGGGRASRLADLSSPTRADRPS
jgi:diguanylate cyclase (GGDEF)-like protein